MSEVGEDLEGPYRLMAGRPVLGAVLGAVAIAFSAILVRLAGETPSTAAVFRCLYALPVLYLLARYERRRYGPRTSQNRILALVAGAFFGADLVFWHISIDYVGAGLATVIGNLQVIIVPVIAWLVLREIPSARTVAAIPLVVTGVVFISGVVGEGAYGSNPAKGVLFGALTALSYAFFLLVIRKSGSDLRQPAGPLFDATLAAAIVSLVTGAIIGDVDLVPAWPAHGWLVTLGLTSQVIGWLLITISLPRLPAALTSVLLTIQPVGSVFLGVVILSEEPSALQLLGVGFVVMGIVTATVKRRKQLPSPGIDAPLVGARK